MDFALYLNPQQLTPLSSSDTYLKRYDGRHSREVLDQIDLQSAKAIHADQHQQPDKTHLAQ